jgi:hypothetical protein
MSRRFSARVSCSCSRRSAAPPEAAGRPVEVWFADEARVGQQGTITSRPRAPCDRRYEWVYLFGAICPPNRRGAHHAAGGRFGRRCSSPRLRHGLASWSRQNG